MVAPVWFAVARRAASVSRYPQHRPCPRVGARHGARPGKRLASKL